MKIQIKPTDKEFIKEFGYPTFKPGDAGYDLRANLHAIKKAYDNFYCISLDPGEAFLIPTGFAIHINDETMCAKIYPRSGLGHKTGLVVGNSVGIIDSSYQGEIMVSALNRSDHPIDIQHGDRIAQLLFEHVLHPEFEEVEEFSEVTGRGRKGFGFSGVR